MIYLILSLIIDFNLVSDEDYFDKVIVKFT